VNASQKFKTPKAHHPREKKQRKNDLQLLFFANRVSHLFCGEDKGHTTRMCQITILKQKEIAEAKARQNQPKQVLHTASCHSPYIPEYVANHPAAFVTSASHSQASWPQLPPPPLQPTYSRSQQPDGRHHSQQQREFREESEARTVNSTMLESKHIY
jgi:hypothetical protein